MSIRALPSLALAISVALGCAGTLDPTQFADTGGGGEVCDAPSMVFAPSCAQSSCHASTLPAGGLDLLSDGVAARLLGHAPDPVASMYCGAAVTTPYLVARSSPAAGLLFDKLASPPPCGVQMPVATTLTAFEATCLREWATAVTTGAITR